jgi:multisubunit Na+/H+ antiporter MnhF subunit
VFSFASHQPSIIDLSLALGLLSLPGSLLLAHFLERWL